MDFLKSFIQDCKYYDLEKREIKTILKYANLKGRTLLDVGTGIGRLAFPLSKYTKKIIALDNNRKLIDYCKKKRSKKINFVRINIEKFIKTNKERFDVILIAWPVFNKKAMECISKIMHKGSKIIFITCDNNSEYEKIPNRIEKSKNFEQDIKNKKELIKFLTKSFHVLKKKKVGVSYSFPNEKKTLKVLSDSFKLWFGIDINRKNKDKLSRIIKKYKWNKKVIIPERVLFYLIEQK